MKMRRIVCFFFVIPSFTVFSQEPPSSALASRLKSVREAAEDFIRNAPSSATVDAWLKESGPVYGNYCGVSQADNSYESPCLNRLDCGCKARDFSATLARFLTPSTSMLESHLGKGMVNAGQSVDYQNFLKSISLKLLAAELKGVTITESLKSANALYAKDPKKAQAELDKLMDENGVIRKKIEEINVERLKFKDARFEADQPSEWTTKTHSVATQPFNIIAGLFSLNYEQVLSRIFSFRVGVSFLGSGLITDTYLGFGNAQKDFSAFLTLGLKSFVWGQTLKSGAYIEPYLDVGYEDVAINGIHVRQVAMIPAIMVGVEKVFPFGGHVEAGLGGGYHCGIIVSDGAPSNVQTFFLVPKFRASVGFAW